MKKTVALVGYGRIAKRHIEAIKSNDKLELVAICDNDNGKLLAAQRELDIDCYPDYRDIPSVDILSILTPSGLHHKHCQDIAINIDCKYIICEKPISLKLQDAIEAYNICENLGKTLIPVYQNRYNPIIMYIRQLINNGQLGYINNYVMNVFWNRDDSYYKNSWHGTKELDGGIIYTQASHYIDMLISFFGNPIESLEKGSLSLGCNTRGLAINDTVYCLTAHNNGAIGSINVTVNVPNKNYETEFTLVTQNGVICIGGTNLNKIKFWDIDGTDKPNFDFEMNHLYGLGHDNLYDDIANDKMDMIPKSEEVLAGIKFMEGVCN